MTYINILLVGSCHCPHLPQITPAVSSSFN